MKPDKLSIYDLFQKERRYVVPLYQRAYVWNENDQWQPLWDDIERQAEAYRENIHKNPKRTHFLGAVVLNVEKTVGNSVARSEIIDGQQRLTTLQLFIGALRDYAISVNSDFASQIAGLTSNQYEKIGIESSFKVWPTNADRNLFRAIMMSGSPEALLVTHRMTDKSDLPRLMGAYCYFYRKIVEYINRIGNFEKCISSFLQALKLGLQLVVIELENNDDPQIIFETLNARGQPLLPSDLIRNTIFHQASTDFDHGNNEKYADELYEHFWYAFDNFRVSSPINGEDRYWHMHERQGRLTRPRIDLFIFHFLVMKTGRELAISHIFQEFRDWRDQSGESLEEFLSDLQKYAQIFRNLITPDGNKRAAIFAHRLRALDTSTLYPLLLYVLGMPLDRMTPADSNQIIADIESWLIRRLICQLTNKNYNKFFVSLLLKVKEVEMKCVNSNVDTDSNNIAKLNTSAVISAAVREELMRSFDETTRWPNNSEFESGWLQKAVYVKSRPDRAVMLLAAIDAAMRTKMNDFSSTPAELTVEHLLPQQGSLLDYPYPPALGQIEEISSELRRSRTIHTIGNLTLVTQALNSSLSNGPFKDKRPKIASNSGLRLNALFQDQNIIAWSEIEIAARGRDMFLCAKNVWPRPET